MIIRFLYLILFIQIIAGLPTEIFNQQIIKQNINNETNLQKYISNGLAKLTDQYKKDPDGTIDELQEGFKRALEDGAKIPRWTRGEIIDTLENITNADPKDIIQTITNSRQQHQRAIMLVMPYTPKDTDLFNMEELYTKPPITHIIGTETGKSTGTQRPLILKNNFDILGPEVSTYRPPFHKRPVKPTKFTKPPAQIHEEVWEPSYITEEKPTTKSPKPAKQVNQKEPLEDLYVSEERPRKEVVIKQDIPINVRKPVPMKPNRFANHKYPEETELISPNEGMRVITAPTLVTKGETVDTDYWSHPPKQNKPIMEYKPQSLVRPNPVQSSVYKAPSTTMRPRYRTTTTSIPTTSKSTTTKSPFADIGVPEDMKDLVKEISYGIVEPVKTHKYSSQYDASSVTFHKQKPENVRDILDSIGVIPTQTSTTLVPDISDIADSLTPEMRELLMSFGLLANPNQKPMEPTTTSRARIESDLDPYSYTQFKPLPDSAPSREDMQEFLAGFGLTGNSQRSAKRLEPTEAPTHLIEVPAIEMGMIPESMHDVLADIGLSKRKEKKLALEDSIKNQDYSHVFNPDSTYITEEEIKKVNQLLDAIKQLDKLNRTATPDDLKDMNIENIRDLTKLLKLESALPLDEQKQGPDPLQFDFGVEKNEVKRQENSSTTANPSTTEEPRNPSLEALEESFGGTSSSVTPEPEVTVPPTRRTGFYYLVDWNTFLEVGEEDKKVNIRFSPKAGDPSRFLRVNVP